MLKSKQVTRYCVADDMPRVSHCPQGTRVYDLLSRGDWFTRERIESLMREEVGALAYAIQKYDHVTEPENAEMVKELKLYRVYLETCLLSLEATQ